MFDYLSFKARANQNREQFEADSTRRAQAADAKGYYNPNMFNNETRNRWNNSLSRAQQIGNPWDAWFQAAEEGGWQAPTSRVRNTPRNNAALGSLTSIENDPTSSFNDNVHMRPSVRALRGR